MRADRFVNVYYYELTKNYDDGYRYCQLNLCIVMKSKFVYSRGFTLTELLATIAIAAIVMSMAVPNFMGTIRNNRLTSSTNEFITSLKFARSEAIKRGLVVTVRPVDGSSCTGGGLVNWEDGWDIFLDTNPPNGNGRCDDEPDPALALIRTHERLPNTFTLRFNGVGFISYQPNGTSTNAGSFVLCDDSDNNGLPDPYTSKRIIVSLLGRVRVGADANNDGIPERADGTPISLCVPPF